MNEVIKVEHVQKLYKLYDKPIARLKESLSIRKKSYHTEHFALSDINFDVKQGECIGIIGTNGSGKSTLLKIITGVLNATKGTVEVNGKISALLELGAGFNMDYTGIENIYLNGTMMGFTKEEVDAKINQILDFAEIGDFVYQPVKTYSSGMFARLAFAVAINVEPDILIVDEALSVGDIFFQAKCYQKFNEFKSEGKTIVFVSHDMSSVLKYCDRCLLINKGKQIKLGDTAEVIDIYKKILVNQFDEDQTDQVDDAELAKKNQEDKTRKLWKESMVLNPNLSDYGDQRAVIEDFAIFDDKDQITTSIYKGTEFKIKMRVRFNEEVKNPIFAFTIKDIKGTDITGTNTLLEDATKKVAHKGEVIEVCFMQKMNLQGAHYFLSLGCTGFELDELVVYHRLYDVCNIEVYSHKNSIGYYDMNSKVSYK